MGFGSSSSGDASRIPAAELDRLAAHPVPAAPAPDPDEGKAITFIGDERRIVRLLNGLPGDWDDFSGGEPIRGVRAYLAAALAYICIRYRATKVCQAPLVVMRETDNGEEYIRQHPANDILRDPNPDYGMRRLVEATETYLCLTGSCLWVKQRDRTSAVRMIYPFGRDDFTVESDGTRLYSNFVVQDRDIAPEDVVYFSYFSPTDPLGSVAPLDAALAQLNIAQALSQRVKSHVRNAMTPGAIYIPHEDWAGGDKEFRRLKSELTEMYRGINSGKPMIAEGGGKIERGFTLEDLQLGELWREVEAVVCGVFGVPASLVGTIIGLENSPWSHLKTAKESFYDETVIPEWEMLEEPITKSLLREYDDDKTHIVRFDRSRISALQKDQAIQATIAATVQRFTSVNERRTMIGQKRSTDEGADDIPELMAPAVPVAPPKPPAGTGDGAEADGTSAADKASRRRLRFQAKAWKRFASLRVAYVADLADQYASQFESAAATQLAKDAERIAEIAHSTQTAERRRGKSRKDTGDAEDAITAGEAARMMLAIETYLNGASGDSWAKATAPIFVRTAEAGVQATVAVDLGIDIQLLRPHLEDWIRREAAFLITNVTDTTKDDVRKALADSLDAGEGITGTVKRIRELTTFNRARATLVGRTETTRTLTGAPLESLNAYADATAQQFTKTWLATDDDRVRPEHWALNGETVATDAVFSNGLAHPGEPNCRCGLTYGVEGVEP